MVLGVYSCLNILKVTRGQRLTGKLGKPTPEPLMPHPLFPLPFPMASPLFPYRLVTDESTSISCMEILTQGNPDGVNMPSSLIPHSAQTSPNIRWRVTMDSSLLSMTTSTSQHSGSSISTQQLSSSRMASMKRRRFRLARRGTVSTITHLSNSGSSLSLPIPFMTGSTQTASFRVQLK